MIIDRIEEKIVICEDENGQTVELSIDKFILPIQDGDSVIQNTDGLYETNKEETEKRKKNIENRFNNLFK
jgi:flagellar basal body rod protein FlgF